MKVQTLAGSVALSLLAVLCRAEEPNAPSPVVDYFASWFDRVAKTQAEQPHWVTPLVTVTARLEQEFRYDQIWQSRPHGESLYSFGGGKGLELIPTEHTEVIVGVPAYLSRNHGEDTDGFTDWNLLLKYRLLSANEESGNYIVTAFLGLTLPTGSEHNTTDHTVIAPTIAFGKGWGDFDVQGTLGMSIPDDGAARPGPGTPILGNLAFQYRVLRYFWPEVEVNYTYWPNGDRHGDQQVYVTPGLVIGKVPIWKRLGVTIGAGFQVAVTTHATYHNASIVSVRFPF
jgi:Putative MetA-pathway of phenol degradation